MPNKDGTGPNGKGPRTGRGLGNCSDNRSKKRLNFGRRPRCRRGLGRGPFAYESERESEE